LVLTDRYREQAHSYREVGLSTGRYYSCKISVFNGGC